MSDKRMDLVREHLKLFAAKDWTRYREMFLPGVVYEERATGLRFEGVEPTLKAVQTWTTAFPDLKPTIKNLLVQEDMVMAELAWDGTHTGLLKGPFGEIPATGKKGTVTAVLIYHFEGNKIREFRHYFDLMTVLKQIGVPAHAMA